MLLRDGGHVMRVEDLLGFIISIAVVVLVVSLLYRALV